MTVCLSVCVCVWTNGGGKNAAGRLGGGKHVTSLRGEHCQDLGSKKNTSAQFLQHGSERSWQLKKQTDANQCVFRIQQVLGNDPGQLFNIVAPSFLLLNGLLASE